MLIVHSDGYGLTNLDNVTEIVVVGRYIQAYTVDGRNGIIGKFDDENHALQAISKMIMECRTGQRSVLTLESES